MHACPHLIWHCSGHPPRCFTGPHLRYVACQQDTEHSEADVDTEAVWGLPMHMMLDKGLTREYLALACLHV